MAISTSLLSRLTEAKPVLRGGAIISTTGREGTGKSAFALSAAPVDPSRGRLVYINMDRKPQGDYIDEIVSSRKILIPKLNYAVLHDGKSRKFDKALGLKMWEELSDLTTDALTDSGVFGVAWDTATFGWALARMARFGKLTQVQPYHYNDVNAEFESILYSAEAHDKIFIALHKMSKEYKIAGPDKKESWTGRYEQAGFSHMDFVANIRLEHFKRSPEEGGEFGVRVLQNKIEPELDGEEFTGDACIFPMLAWRTWGEKKGHDLADYL